MKYTGLIYGKEISAKSMTDLKRKASIIANGRYKAFDTLDIRADDGDTTIECKLVRSNKLTPWGEFTPGTWV